MTLPASGTPAWLRDGRPFDALSEFADITVQAAAWALCAVECPWWARAPDEVYPRRPIVTFLMALPSGPNDAPRLLRRRHYFERETSALVAAAAQDLSEPLEHVPVGCLPRRVVTLWHRCGVHPGAVSRSDDTDRQLAERIAVVGRGHVGASDRAPVASIQVLDVEAAQQGTGDGQPALTRAAIERLAEEAAAHLQASHTPLQPADDPRWLDTSAGRELFAALAASPLSTPACTISRCVPFATGDAAFPAGVLVAASALQCTPDLQRDHGPLPAGGVAGGRVVSLRLHRDAGDSVELAPRLDGAPNPTASYKDWLHHEDGELVVTVIADEVGADMADIAWVREQQQPPQQQGESSAAAAVVPRVYFHAVAGRAVKPSPLHAAELELARFPPTSEMLAAVRAALSTLEPYWGDLSAVPPVTLTDAARPCKWCGRRRNACKRCSACRAVAYCCAAHQTLDWRDGKHAKLCKALREEAAAVHAALGGPDEAGPARLAAESDALVVIAAARRAARRRAGQPAASTRATVACVHIPDLDSREAVRRFASLCREAAEFADRIVLCAPQLDPALDGTVLAVSLLQSSDDDDASAVVRDCPTTGVLGDVWRTGHDGSERDDTGVALAIPPGEMRVRLCCCKLNHLAERSGAAGLPRCDAYVHTSGLHDGLSFFDAFPRTMLERALADGAELVFGFESRRAASASVGVMHQQAAAVSDGAARALTRALPRDASVIATWPELAGRPHGVASAGDSADSDGLRFANLFGFTLRLGNA